MDVPIDFVVRSTGTIDLKMLRAYAQRRLAFALRRFQDRSHHATVRVIDVNGPKRGIDSRCVITLQLRSGRRIDAEAMTAWPYASVTLAAKRLNAAVRREHEKAQLLMRRPRRNRVPVPRSRRQRPIGRSKMDP
jgi:putative sigma-54 modulation protein